MAEEIRPQLALLQQDCLQFLRSLEPCEQRNGEDKMIEETFGVVRVPLRVRRKKITSPYLSFASNGSSTTTAPGAYDGSNGSNKDSSGSNEDNNPWNYPERLYEAIRGIDNSVENCRSDARMAKWKRI
jgi:hypothetical protein